MKKIWAWLNGRKATIGAMAGVVLAWVQAEGWMGPHSAIALASVLSIWTGVAVADKIRKGTI